MCTAKSEGGQRCYSHAKEALVKAHAKKVDTEIAYAESVAAKAPARDREKLLRKGLAAEYAYEDALALYASTDSGRADVMERIADAPSGYHQADAPNDPYRTDDIITLKTALNEGKHLADRAAESKRAVRAGEMTPERAIDRAEFPNEFAKAHRASNIDSLAERIYPSTPVIVSGPAAPSAA